MTIDEAVNFFINHCLISGIYRVKPDISILDDVMRTADYDKWYAFRYLSIEMPGYSIVERIHMFNPSIIGSIATDKVDNSDSFYHDVIVTDECMNITAEIRECIKRGIEYGGLIGCNQKSLSSYNIQRMTKEAKHNIMVDLEKLPPKENRSSNCYQCDAGMCGDVCKGDQYRYELDNYQQYS